MKGSEKRPVLASGLLAAVLLIARELPGDTAGRWVGLGPYGPGSAITALAVVPTSPESLLVSTNGGGFLRSVDGGVSWQWVGAGLLFGAAGSAFAVDPTSSSTVYAGTYGVGVFKTTDGGATWSATASGLPGQLPYVYDIAVDPKRPSTVYAGTPFGVYRSDDAAANWTPASTSGLFNTNALCLAINPSDTSTLYACSAFGVYATVDAGKTWKLLTGLPLATPISIALDPRSPRTIYVASELGAFRSTDAGATWTAINSGLPAAVNRLLVSPATGTVFAGTSQGIFELPAGGTFWAPVTGQVGSSSIRALGVDPLSASTLYAGGGNGLFRSVDAGQSWLNVQSAFAPLGVTVLAADPVAPNTLFAGTYAGLFKSSNAGATWTASSGLPQSTIFALAVDALSPAVYASVGTGLLYKSGDRGSSFAPSGRPGLAGGFSLLAIDPRVSSILYAGSYVGLYRSDDGGENWSKVGGLPDGGIFAFAIDPLAPSTLYAGGKGLFKSRDGGATWSALHGLSDPYVSVIAVDPKTPATLYVGTLNPSGFPHLGPDPGGLFKSTDGGATWAGAGLDGTAPSAIAVDPTDPRIVYASLYFSSFRTVTGGGTWLEVDEGLGSEQRTIAIDPFLPSRVYAGTGAGVFKRVFGQAFPCARTATALCLNQGRFQIEVAWTASSISQSGSGQAVSLTANTGAFWFFDPTNLELVVKVLDGRSINGKWWVFYGSLTNVEFTLMLIDTETGAVKTYTNSQGQLASVADTSAF